MCHKCEADKIRQKLKQENPLIYQFVDDHNAIWQQALTLKLVMIHFIDEMEAHNAENYYKNLLEVFTEVLGVLDQVETESFFKCREVLKNVK
jgi:hypothetical protein